MDRRQYLVCTGCLGVAVTAGCLGSGDDESDRTADDRTGERAIARSVGRLNRAALALNDSDGLDDTDEVSFDPTEPRDLIDDARGFLETAETESETDHESAVEELRAYADILGKLTTVTETVADETIEDDAETVTAVIETDGDLDDATRTIDDRNTSLAAAREDLDAAQAGLDSLDRDRLEALSIVDLAEIDGGAERLDDVLASMITLGSGYETLLEGYEALETAETQTDAENHEVAADGFATAGSRFEQSRTTFDDGIGDAPSRLETRFETARCQSDGLVTAAEHLEASATAAAANDQTTASSERSAGEDALDELGTCS